VIVSWLRFRRAVKIKWFDKLSSAFPAWQQTINVVFLPIYNEDSAVVRATLQALLQSTYPHERLYIVCAGEERKLAHWQDIQQLIQNEYRGLFADILFFTHPAHLSGEIPGKGSNIHYAEMEFKNYADRQGWDYKNIIVSVFDIDTIVHPEYFSHLTYLYLSHPDPSHSSFQPITLYNNNIWDSPAVLRIMAFGTTFWMLFSLARLDNLVTFSSHSMSFKAIMECGGHAKNIVSEDSRIYFQCWFANGGNYEVTPLYIPVSMDTVRDDTIWRSLKNLYYQQRRWAWGVENIPYLLWEFRKHPEIAWYKKLILFFHEFEGKWSWAVVAILITVLGRLPLYFADDAVRQSALFFNTPQVLQTLMTIAMLGLLISMILSMLILPARPRHHARHRYVYMLAQWVLLPISLILFSSVPCIDAVTHLMRGKYLGFNVSNKKRK
jgi:cellulose synthase/poly-beta-1,6-N-acetylglucosamine synthase-like glycosyltransferase